MLGSSDLRKPRRESQLSPAATAAMRTAVSNTNHNRLRTLSAMFSQPAAVIVAFADLSKLAEFSVWVSLILRSRQIIRRFARIE